MNDPSAPRDETPADATRIRDQVREAHLELMRALEPHLPELHRYARGLARCPFSAEDLCQESVSRVFFRLGQGGEEPRDLRAYLFRVLTNVWRDELRRRRAMERGLERTVERGVDSAAYSTLPTAEGSLESVPPLPTEVREALERLVGELPARERAAVLLRDAWGFSGAETAAALEISEGAVKAALHRGRVRLAEIDPDSTPWPQRAKPTDEDRALIDRLVEAFNSRNVERLLGALHPESEVDLLGVLRSSAEDARRLVLTHTLQDPALARAEAVEFRGEVLVLLRHHPAEGAADGAEPVGEILRVEIGSGAIIRTRWYYFCPEIMRTVATELGLPWRAHGHHGV